MQKLIECNSERVSCELSKGKSAVWMHFAHVMFDGTAVPFVKFMKCSSVLQWKCRDGTSGLHSHIEYCKSRVAQRKITGLPGFASVVEAAKLPSSVKSVQCTNRKLLRLLADIKESLLQEVIAVLQLFDTATKCLSSGSTDETAADEGDQLKRHLGNQLEQYFTVSPLHHTATLLDPGLKNNNELMTPEARQQAVTSLRQLVSAVPDDEDQQQAVQETDDTSRAPPAKKAKLEDSFYATLFAHPSSATATEVGCCFE